MEAAEAQQLARERFVTDDNTYGCAETSFTVLKHAYHLPEPDDSAPAMALNGGIAYSGGMCGAISGAALALGLLAARRVDDHSQAKRVARKLTMKLADEFTAEYGTTQCRELTRSDFRIQEEHDRFIESGVWKTTCAGQLEFAVGRLAELDAEGNWEAAVEALD